MKRTCSTTIGVLIALILFGGCVAYDALKSLRTTEDAAAAWSVNRQRANAHVRRLHERYAVGMRVGARTWILTQQEIDAHPPARPGRPRKTNSAAAT